MPMNERCRDCNGPAAFRCEAREVGPRRVVKENGVTKVLQPYLEFFLCADCCRRTVASDDPPRSARPMRHYQRTLAPPPAGSSTTCGSLMTGADRE